MGTVEDLTTRSDRTVPWLRNVRTMCAVDSQDQVAARQALLACYLAGWAEANPLKIVLVTSPDYQFRDPLIGVFGRASLPQYFEILRRRFAIAGVTMQRELAFVLRCSAQGMPRERVFQFYREAPKLGLSGIATITVGDRGVSAEQVAYDSNRALDVMTRALPDDDSGQSPATPNVPKQMSQDRGF